MSVKYSFEAYKFTTRFDKLIIEPEELVKGVDYRGYRIELVGQTWIFQYGLMKYQFYNLEDAKAGLDELIDFK
jgi:hypothetical protein